VFSTYGTVTHIHVMNPHPRSGQRCAFVFYQQKEAGDDAVKVLDNQYRIREDAAHPIVVRWSKDSGFDGADRRGDGKGAWEDGRPRRTEPPIDGHKLFLGGLPSDVAEEELRLVFGTYGEVTHCHIMGAHPRSGLRCAFMYYDRFEAAEDAIKVLDGIYKIREDAEDAIQVRWANKDGEKMMKGGNMWESGWGGKGDSWTFSKGDPWNAGKGKDKGFSKGWPPAWEEKGGWDKGGGWQEKGWPDWGGKSGWSEKGSIADSWGKDGYSKDAGKGKYGVSSWDNGKGSWDNGKGNWTGDRWPGNSWGGKDMGKDMKGMKGGKDGGKDGGKGWKGMPLESSPDPNGTKLYVANLPEDIQENAVEYVFSTYGKVEKVHLMTGKVRHGCISAFVEFGSAQEASTAILSLDNKYEIRAGYGPITVKLANAKGFGKGFQE